MSTRTLLRFGAVLTAASIAGLAGVPSTHAASLGGLDVVPAKGTAETPMSVVTERGCAEPAQRVSAILTGKGLPDGGQVVVSPSEVLFSTTRPMELPLSNAFVVYAQRNATALSGTYRITVRCTDRIGVTTLDTFSTTMTWSTPGNSLKTVAKAEYAAKSTAGVVAKAVAAQKAARDSETSADPSAEPKSGSGTSESTAEPTVAPRPGEQPLANDERADGSNPGIVDDTTAAEPAQNGSSSTTTWLVLGAGLLALLTAAGLFLRGRRTSN